MSSVVFQPLLHDPLGWKPSNTTYTEHYKWRKYRSTSKDKKTSTYGQKQQRELNRKKQKSNPCLPLASNKEQTISQVILIKKPNEDIPPRPITCHYTPSRTPVYVVESKQRPSSADANPISEPKVSQRPPSVPVTTEEKSRPLTAVEIRSTKPFADANNDSSRHWLTYPNPRTPQYIIDIKKRLGQLKVPSTLARPTSASNSTDEKPTTTTDATDRPTSASSQTQQKPKTDADQHHFLNYNVRQTPDELRSIRHRIDKHRYNPSLDNYPPRPKTCPVRTSEIQKPVTPPQQLTENDQTQVEQPKIDAWVADDERQTLAEPDNESPSILIQMVDCDGLPNEYVEALETANVAQEEYEKNCKKNVDRRPENPVYRLSTTLPDYRSDSFVSCQSVDQPIDMSNQVRQVARTSQNDFGTWVRTATEKERASAMKILQDVLNQPIVDFDTQPRRKSLFKQAPAPPPVRASSATRKLGRTRTQHRFPCEICEKLLIKRHVWDLSGSETLTCPHQAQGCATQIQT